MSVLRELERMEQRVLAALQCVDATTRVPLREPCAVEGEGISLVRNRSGLYVIREWAQLPVHATAFQAPPPQPPVGSLQLELSVRDPSGRYLPRRVGVLLPRDPQPNQAAAAGSLFRPIDVAMYPSASASTGANWVVLRVAVTETASGDALGGVLLRVVSNGSVLARGLTDWRGEALVPVAGVPVTTWSTEPDAVIVTEIPVTLEAVFDPNAGQRAPALAVREGRAPVELPMVDPEALENARAGLPQAATPVSLAAGRSLSLSLQITLP